MEYTEEGKGLFTGNATLPAVVDENAKGDTALQIEAEQFVSETSSDGGSAKLNTLIVVETTCLSDKSIDCENAMQQRFNIINRSQSDCYKSDDDYPSQLNNCLKSISGVKNLDLDMESNLIVQTLEPIPSCSGAISATEAALMAATGASCCMELSRVMRPKYEDIETQFNSIELENVPTPSDSMPSIGSLVCRICHNADNPEQLVSPCLCKGSLTYVHIHCLERWISTSRCTTCELCQFTYNTEQTLRYTCLQSLRLWYSRAMSRRALQEDCQMFSLLTLVAFGIVGTLLVGIQYYALHTQSWGLSKLWTKSWMLFFLFMTITVYFANVYMLIKSQLTPWYRWWQSARDIKLILENRRPFRHPGKGREDAASTISMFTHHDLQDIEQQPNMLELSEQQQQQLDQEPDESGPQYGSAPATPPQFPITNYNMVTDAIDVYIDGPNQEPCKTLQMAKMSTKEPTTTATTTTTATATATTTTTMTTTTTITTTTATATTTTTTTTSGANKSGHDAADANLHCQHIIHNPVVGSPTAV